MESYCCQKPHHEIQGHWTVRRSTAAQSYSVQMWHQFIPETRCLLCHLQVGGGDETSVPSRDAVWRQRSPYPTHRRLRHRVQRHRCPQESQQHGGRCEGGLCSGVAGEQVRVVLWSTERLKMWRRTKMRSVAFICLLFKVETHCTLLVQHFLTMNLWSGPRAESEHSKEVVKPYDWTYTTDYRGTLIGEETQMKVGWDWRTVWELLAVNALSSSSSPLKVSETTERIDMEKLKAREQIMFFDEVLLFEDELHDHGVSMISVKIVSDDVSVARWCCYCSLTLTLGSVL